MVIELKDISRTFEQNKKEIHALSHVSLNIEKEIFTESSDFPVRENLHWCE